MVQEFIVELLNWLLDMFVIVLVDDGCVLGFVFCLQVVYQISELGGYFLFLVKKGE